MFPSYEAVRQLLEVDIHEITETRKKNTTERKKRTRILIISPLVMLVVTMFIKRWFIGLDSVISFIDSISSLFFVVWFVAIIVVWVKSMNQSNQLRGTFKQKIVSQMAKAIVTQSKSPHHTDKHTYACEYEPTNKLNMSYIENSQLFNTRIDIYKGEDLIRGCIGLTNFEFSEVHLMENVETTDSEGKSTTSTRTTFKGAVFVADFNKEFEGFTVVRPRAQGILGKLTDKLQSMGSGTLEGQSTTKIELESQEFNENFEVIATNEIEARYILTSSMYERIIDFQKRHQVAILISFAHSHMTIAVSTTKNYFEITSLGDDMEKELQAMYNDFLLFFGMIEEFDLNTRIWTKQ